ncbi:DUF1810 domain-containing protein [Novosphingobium lindaniclasticum]
MSGLDRFVEAQRRDYATVTSELARGVKQSHWIWYVFPQLAGLGSSETSRYYALSGLTEARAYLAHPLLGARLGECTDAMLGWAGERSASAILGELDALKFGSSMTLFEAAGGGERHAHALDAFCQGRRDERTLRLLGLGSSSRDLP